MKPSSKFNGRNGAMVQWYIFLYSSCESIFYFGFCSVLTFAKVMLLYQLSSHDFTYILFPHKIKSRFCLKGIVIKTTVHSWFNQFLVVRIHNTYTYYIPPNKLVQSATAKPSHLWKCFCYDVLGDIKLTIFVSFHVFN